VPAAKLRRRRVDAASYSTLMSHWVIVGHWVAHSSIQQVVEIRSHIGSQCAAFVVLCG